MGIRVEENWWEEIMNSESPGEKSAFEMIFHVREESTDIALLHNGEEIGRSHIEPNRELLEGLLPAVDALLLEHGAEFGELSDVRVESGLPDGYSSRRIAETVSGVWKRFGRR